MKSPAFAGALRRAMTARSLKQWQFADLLEIDAGSLSRILSLKAHTPKPDVVEDWCRKLGSGERERQSLLRPAMGEAPADGARHFREFERGAETLAKTLRLNGELTSLAAALEKNGMLHRLAREILQGTELSLPILDEAVKSACSLHGLVRNVTAHSRAQLSLLDRS